MDKCIAVVVSNSGQIFTVRMWGVWFKVFTQTKIAKGLVSSLGEPSFCGNRIVFNKETFRLYDDREEVFVVQVQEAYEITEGRGYKPLPKSIIISCKGEGLRWWRH